MSAKRFNESDKSANNISRRSFIKRLGLGGLGACGLTMLSGCGPHTPGVSFILKEEDLGTGAHLGDGKVLRVGMEAAYAPYNWQTGEASDYTIPIQNVAGAYADGYDVQVAKIIAKNLGVEPIAVKMSFSGLIDALNNGQIDIICAGMTATEERMEAIDFTDPYFEGGFGLMVAKGSPYEQGQCLEDFRGASVLGQKNTLLDEVIDEIPDVVHLTPVETVPNQISHLLQGACDAITYNTENTKGFLKASPDLVAIIFEEGKGFSKTIPCSAGIKKGQAEVLPQLNSIIAQITDEQREQMWNDCLDRQPA